MVALARKTLIYEWRRFLPAMLAVGFTGLLQLLQVALVLGILGSTSLYITGSSADVWVSYPGTQSVGQGRSICPDVESRLLMDPAVERVEPYLWVDGDWRGPTETGGVSVFVSGIDPRADGMMFSKALASNLRALERFRLEHTGFVFQGFNLFPALTALEQVALPLNYMGLLRGAAREQARRSLEEVGLTHRSALRPAELSGGEKQRAAIARALAKNPDLLFADEPTSALDAANGQIIIEILHRIARSHGTTVLCVSHDPRLVIHADRVLAMEDGRILSDRRNHPSAAVGQVTAL